MIYRRMRHDGEKSVADPFVRKMFQVKKQALARAERQGLTSMAEKARVQIETAQALYSELECPTRDELESKLIDLGFKTEQFRSVVEFAKYYHRRIEGCDENEIDWDFERHDTVE